MTLTIAERVSRIIQSPVRGDRSPRDLANLVEAEFGITITDEEVKAWRQPADIVQLVTARTTVPS